MRRFQSVTAANEVWLSQARADRLERNFTQTLRRQQDEAYEQSLLADEEKERQRQRERDAVKQAEEAEERARRDVELRKEEIARQKIELAALVPSEPPVDTVGAIAVVFKLPSGTRLERRFNQTDSVLVSLQNGIILEILDAHFHSLPPRTSITISFAIPIHRMSSRSQRISRKGCSTRTRTWMPPRAPPTRR